VNHKKITSGNQLDLLLTIHSRVFESCLFSRPRDARDLRAYNTQHHGMANPQSHQPHQPQGNKVATKLVAIKIICETVPVSSTVSTVNSSNRIKHHRIIMSKYMHEYNTGRCRKCGQNGCYETEEGTEELVKTSDLLTCFGCNSVQYCCKEHQKEDWPNHKVFCKRSVSPNTKLSEILALVVPQNRKNHPHTPCTTSSRRQTGRGYCITLLSIIPRMMSTKLMIVRQISCLPSF
jgi:hypothetical protein